MSPAKTRVEARRVNDELAQRPEGKSLVVGCTLDEVSNMSVAFASAKALTGDARLLSERLADQHVTALSEWPRRPRSWKRRCDAFSALPPPLWHRNTK